MVPKVFGSDRYFVQKIALERSVKSKNVDNQTSNPKKIGIVVDFGCNFDADYDGAKSFWIGPLFLAINRC